MPGPTRRLANGVLESYGPVKVWPSASMPKPAAVPATWLPCPPQSNGFGSGLGVEVTGSGLLAS